MAWRDHIPGLKRRQPVRVGVLNTGELVMVDDAGHAQVFSASTTDLIRDVLAGDERVIDSLPIGAGPTT